MASRASRQAGASRNSGLGPRALWDGLRPSGALPGDWGRGQQGYLRIAVVEIGGQEAVRQVTLDEAGRRQLLQRARGGGAGRT